MRSKPEDFPLTLTVKDVAEIMRISPNKVYDISRRKDFPALRDGNRIIIPRDAFFKWMDPSYDNKHHDTYEPNQRVDSSKTTDRITKICTEAIEHAIRNGEITVSDVVKWALICRMQ